MKASAVTLSFSMTSERRVSQEVSDLPKDANTIVAILKDMGVTDYEPKVINQLLEFTYSKFKLTRLDLYFWNEIYRVMQFLKLFVFSCFIVQCMVYFKYQ